MGPKNLKGFNSQNAFSKSKRQFRKTSCRPFARLLREISSLPRGIKKSEVTLETGKTVLLNRKPLKTIEKMLRIIFA